MAKAKSYKVIQDHGNYKKGGVRKCHPSVAAILAEQGLILMDEKEVKDDEIKDHDSKDKKEDKKGKKSDKKDDKNPDDTDDKKDDDLPPDIKAALETNDE